MSTWVYIVANSKRGTLYVGVTDDLVRRVFQHRECLTRGFTSRYAVTRLVHYEQYEDPRTAIQREKNLKHWSRAWKIALIEKGNPDWRDRVTRSRREELMPASSPGMTNERFAVAVREVRRGLARDGFNDQLRAEVRLLKDHPSAAGGNAFLEAAPANLAEELDRLENSREGGPLP